MIANFLQNDWIFEFCLHFLSFGLKRFGHDILDSSCLWLLLSDATPLLCHDHARMLASSMSYNPRFSVQPNNHEHSQPTWFQSTNTNCESIEYGTLWWIIKCLINEIYDYLNRRLFGNSCKILIFGNVMDDLNNEETLFWLLVCDYIMIDYGEKF